MIVAILTAVIPLPVAVVGHEGSTVLVSLIGLQLLRFDRWNGLVARTSGTTQL